MRLADEVRIQLKGMNPVERESAVRELREVIYEDAYETIASRDDVLACPRCGSIGIVRKGHNPDGSQRWQCRDCRRTFSKTRDTLIGRSKLPVAKWMMYVECFVDCLALRTCASRCEVSLRTAWLMRRRLLKCLERYLPKFVAGAGVSVQLDETYLRESFKGNHTKGKFVMPRTARHRGASLHKRGLGRGADLHHDRRERFRYGVRHTERARRHLQTTRNRGVGRPDTARSARHGGHRGGLSGSIGGVGHRVRASGREVTSHQPDQHAPLEPRRVPSRIQGRVHEASAILSDVVPVATLVP